MPLISAAMGRKGLSLLSTFAVKAVLAAVAAPRRRKLAAELVGDLFNEVRGLLFRRLDGLGACLVGAMLRESEQVRHPLLQLLVAVREPDVPIFLR